MNTTLKRGDAVAFQFEGKWKNGVMVADYPEFHSAIKVKVENLEYTLGKGEVISAEERKRQLEAERREQAKTKYADVIAAWESGKRKAADIARQISEDVDAVRRQIRNAKRWGFIQNDPEN